jgi:hypothetical protein
MAVGDEAAEVAGAAEDVAGAAADPDEVADEEEAHPAAVTIMTRPAIPVSAVLRSVIPAPSFP